MQLTLTGPIEAFIQRQIAIGHKDGEEVTRQALLRWMAEDSETPPHIQSRLRKPPAVDSSPATAPTLNASSLLPDARPSLTAAVFPTDDRLT